MKHVSVSVCACEKCKQMCKNSPCFGTPDDILKLIAAGYKDKLAESIWLDQQWEGIWPVVAPIKTNSGCIFLTDTGLCKLHDLGLKPTEGRIAHHDNKDPENLRRMISFTWVNQLGEDTLKLFNPNKLYLDRMTELRHAYSR